ncbi:hypothetical protein Tco_1081639 [Tanacetum coccineum]|uniref:Uncharacterized protein n=1 Tax=Tanacetum coccineum TaxID=301880 RepID=A0ABQ5HZ15_9ASTR
MVDNARIKRASIDSSWLRLIDVVPTIVEVAEASNSRTLPSIHFPRQHNIVMMILYYRNTGRILSFNVINFATTCLDSNSSFYFNGFYNIFLNLIKGQPWSINAHLRSTETPPGSRIAFLKCQETGKLREMSGNAWETSPGRAKTRRLCWVISLLIRVIDSMNMYATRKVTIAMVDELSSMDSRPSTRCFKWIRSRMRKGLSE